MKKASKRNNISSGGRHFIPYQVLSEVAVAVAAPFFKPMYWVARFLIYTFPNWVVAWRKRLIKTNRGLFNIIRLPRRGEVIRNLRRPPQSHGTYLSMSGEDGADNSTLL